ncbi:MAG: D-alanyl-D-alanine carboxypeptidase [Hyphomicrobiaceae bacterium]|nr:MAG: D-alanyl-D-alanine carboxypeptidase [Hyphomicrobiaceae bacterium]
MTTMAMGRGPLGVLALALCFGVLGNSAGMAAQRSAYVVDAKTGEVLFSRDADAPRYPASLAKMMTLYIVFDLIEQKRLTYQTPVKMTQHAALQAPSNLGLEPGATISVHDAVLALITKSANDVAAALADNLAGSEEKFARVMTWKARQLGMKSTTFRNASGLPDPQQVTTAHDMGVLALRLALDFPDHFKLFATRDFKFNGASYRNHNTLLFTYEGTDGIKTGYTRGSGFNLVASVRRGNKHVIGVLVGGRSAGDRNSQMRALLSAALGRAKSIDKPLIASRKQPPPRLLAQATDERKAQRKPVTNDAEPTAKPLPPSIAAPEKKERLATVAAKLRPTAPQSTDVSPAVAKAPLAAPFETRTKEPPKVAAPVTKTDRGPFQIQVGAYLTQSEAHKRLIAVASTAGPLLQGHAPITMSVTKQSTPLHRARFAGFEEAKATAVCRSLKAKSVDCIVVRAD